MISSTIDIYCSVQGHFIIFDRFDYVLRIETMISDSRLIFSQLKLDEDALNESSGNVYNKENLSNAEKSFKNILTPLSQVTSPKLQALVDRYAFDMELFGYKFNTTTFEASCEIRRTDGTFCCWEDLFLRYDWSFYLTIFFYWNAQVFKTFTNFWHSFSVVFIPLF